MAYQKSESINLRHWYIIATATYFQKINGEFQYCRDYASTSPQTHLNFTHIVQST